MSQRYEEKTNNGEWGQAWEYYDTFVRARGRPNPNTEVIKQKEQGVQEPISPE